MDRISKVRKIGGLPYYPRYPHGPWDEFSSRIKEAIDARVIQEAGYGLEVYTPPLSDEVRPVISASNSATTAGSDWARAWEYEGPFDVEKWDTKRSLYSQWDNNKDLAMLNTLHIETQARNRITAFVDSLKMLISGMLGRNITQTDVETKFGRITQTTIETDDNITITISQPYERG